MEKPSPTQHLLVDFFGVAQEKLKNQELFASTLRDNTNLQLSLLSDPILQILSSGGYTGVAFFQSGHICFRANPEINHLALDILFQDQTDIEKIFGFWAKNFSPEAIRKTTITRGLYEA